MQSYFSPFNFEIDPALYPYGEFPIETYMKFIKEVRESRGYDVTIHVPGSDLYLITGALLEEFEPIYIAVCEFVVDKMNDQAKMYGELYVYQSLVKVVDIYFSLSDQAAHINCEGS
ncbi:hypothetical protein C2S51_037818 [Perilla frutescens var. frutescens]|nr:hypothetical protein C2S51_037818 [Perilla frutescens var. frutescens]